MLGNRVSSDDRYPEPFYIKSPNGNFGCISDIDLLKKKRGLGWNRFESVREEYDWMKSMNKSINKMVFDSFSFARNARFDHGQSPTVKGE